MKNSVILVTRYGMGDAPEELRLKLIGSYLSLMNSTDTLLPNAICFYATGLN